MNSMKRCLPVALLLGLGLGACQSSRSSVPDDSNVAALVRDARFERALQAAQENLDREPSSRQAQRNLRDAQVALLLDAGRRLTLAGRTEEGLELFYKAQGIDGSNEVVRDWINKSRIQLAEDSLTMSGTLTSREELTERREMLIKVLAYLPENEGSVRVSNLRLLANSSLERVEENLAYCVAKGQECYEDGLGSLSNGNLHEASRDFSMSVLHDKNQLDSVAGYSRVNVMVGEEYLRQAVDYEQKGLFDAARMEYERVHQKDPSNTEASDGLDRMEREVRAGRILDEAEMAILRETPKLAEKLLAEAEEMTLVQAHLVDELRLRMRNAAWEKMYQQALALEAEGKLPEAVTAFNALLESAGDYQEAEARRKVLEDFISKAAALYARAAEAEDVATEYSLLREIQIFWPSYLDVQARLKVLQAGRDAEKAPETKAVPAAEVESARPRDRG